MRAKIFSFSFKTRNCLVLKMLLIHLVYCEENIYLLFFSRRGLIGLRCVLNLFLDTRACEYSNQKKSKNSAVHFSVKFPHCFWEQKSEKCVKMLRKFFRKMDSRISAIFFTWVFFGCLNLFVKYFCTFAKFSYCWSIFILACLYIFAFDTVKRMC